MDFAVQSLDMVKSGLINSGTINADQITYNRIKEAGSEKEQLKKASEEFESVFITKMLSEMDKTVDKTGSIFGEKEPYADTFKSIVYQQLGQDIASNPRTTFGLADQIYKQMEKYTGGT